MEYKLQHPDGPVTEKRLDTLVGKRFHTQTQPKPLYGSKISNDHSGPSLLRARKSLCELSPSELEAIVRSVKVDYQTYKGAADLHRVKPALVMEIMASLKKDPEYINKRRLKL